MKFLLRKKRTWNLVFIWFSFFLGNGKEKRVIILYRIIVLIEISAPVSHVKHSEY
jgi:hypothetical protein